MDFKNTKIIDWAEIMSLGLNNNFRRKFPEEGSHNKGNAMVHTHTQTHYWNSLLKNCVSIYLYVAGMYVGQWKGEKKI